MERLFITDIRFVKCKLSRVRVWRLSCVRVWRLSSVRVWRTCDIWLLKLSRYQVVNQFYMQESIWNNYVKPHTKFNKYTFINQLYKPFYFITIGITWAISTKATMGIISKNVFWANTVTINHNQVKQVFQYTFINKHDMKLFIFLITITLDKALYHCVFCISWI